MLYWGLDFFGLQLLFFPNDAGKYAITITSIAVAMILGILMNLVLREPKNETPKKEENTSVEETTKIE